MQSDIPLKPVQPLLKGSKLRLCEQSGQEIRMHFCILHDIIMAEKSTFYFCYPSVPPLHVSDIQTF